MQILVGVLIGLLFWFLLRVVLFGFFTVDQNERATFAHTCLGSSGRSCM
jgi:hypothetical protein